MFSQAMTPTNNNETKSEMTFSAAMGLNRAERRRLGKLNAVKIPGATKPYVKNEKKKAWGLTTFLGHKK